MLLACIACSITSILACWLLPAVSAVRTLTLTVIVGGFCICKPVTLGRVHGLSLMFSALRPAVVVYVGCLVLEQLVHGCASSPDVTPSWRRVVFQGAILAMIVSGFLRANNPLARTDVPFLITIVAALVVATLPPPAVALAGPLCEPVSLLGAAERLVRALMFGFTNIFFVYTSTPPNGENADVNVILMRASAASVWVMGAPLPMLVLSLPMCALAIFRRLRLRFSAEEEEKRPLSPYSELPTRSPGEVAEQDRPDSPAPATCSTGALPVGLQSNSSSMFGALSFREVGPTTGCRKGAAPSRETMEAVAAALEEGGN